MFSITKKIAAFTLCLFFAFANASAQDDFTEWASWNNGITGEGWRFEYTDYTKEDAATAREFWQHLKDMKAVSRDGWAGDYSVGGDTFLDVIRWTPEGGYVRFNASLCMALVRNFDYGDVIASSPYTVELVSRYKPNTTRKFVKVKWGEEHYLIEDDKVKDFCDYVAGVGKYNSPDGTVFGSYEFYSNQSDGSNNQSDGSNNAIVPTVPPDYQHLVKQPIDARITKVGSSYVKVSKDEHDPYNKLITPVTLNVGKAHGVKRGMSFDVLGSERQEKVEVMRVFRSTSRGRVVRYVRKQPGVKLGEWDDGQDTEEPPVSIAWQLTTSVHKSMQDFREQMRKREEKEKNGTPQDK